MRFRSHVPKSLLQDNGDSTLFATEVKNCAGNTINLGIWSAKGQRIREIYVQVPHGTASLGLSLQWMPLASTEDVWHILDVAPNSPADVAGLLPYADYVIGSPEGIVRGEAGLGELIEEVSLFIIALYINGIGYVEANSIRFCITLSELQSLRMPTLTIPCSTSTRR